MAAKPIADLIRDAVRDERYVVSEHAAGRLAERHLLEWQVVDGVGRGVVFRVRADNEPDPVVEMDQTLPDGTPVRAVWAWVEWLQIARLVTVHYLER